MGLAQPKISNKKRQAGWLAKKHTEKMLDMSIANAPSLAFGVKMMEKMGWQQGQGLGANKQGMLEPIKTKQTVNNKGLGFTSEKGVEQVHYALHFERYESVLSSLKPINNIDSSDEEHQTMKKISAVASKNQPVEPIAASCSGIESSSSSSNDEDAETPYRNRNLRRFWKATRAKDVSRYSKNDLDCIIGAKSHALYNADAAGSPDTNLVHGKQSSKEYFNNLQSASNSPSDDSDIESCSKFTPSFQLSSQSAAAAHNSASDEECRPSFGGLSQPTNKECRPTSGGGFKQEMDDDSESRPCFGSNFNHDAASAGGELSNTRGDDNIEKYFKARIAMNYTNCFVKAEEGIGGTLFHSERYDDAHRNMDVNPSESIDQLETVELKPRTKKRKKTSALPPQEEAIEPSIEAPINIKMKKEKKKKKHSVAEVGSGAEVVNNDSTKSYEKIRKKSKSVNVECAAPDPPTHLLNDEVKTKLKKEKRKRNELDDSSCQIIGVVNNISFEGVIMKDSTEGSEETPRKKSKKRRKKDSCCLVAAATDEVPIAVVISEKDGLADLTRIKKDKKKRKKDKDVV